MRLTVAIDTGTRAVGDIVRDLQRAGLTVGEVLEAIGVVTGTATETALPALRGVAGVTAVEEEGSLSVPPHEG